MVFDPFKYPINKLNRIEPQKGRVLISEPFMMDHYFKRSVVYLTEHNPEGTVGFMLNKSLDVEINQVLVDFPKIDAPVYLGGPVQPQNLFYLHTKGDLLADAVKVEDGVYWNGNFEQLKEAIKQKLITKDDIRFFLGYSGWDAEQLRIELKENSWFVKAVPQKKLFSKPEDLWKLIVKDSGSRISPMAEFPEDPQWN